MAGIACCWLRRGWRWVPAAMTAAGFWALVPDMPRLLREDLPSVPLAGILGAKSLEVWLHGVGDIFFLHRVLDANLHEFALHGLSLILLFYNAGIVWLMVLESRGRHCMAGGPQRIGFRKAWRRHGCKDNVRVRRLPLDYYRRSSHLSRMP